MDVNAMATRAVELYLLVVVADVLLAWVQTDPTRWPRRLFHLLTEPLQRPLRWLLRPLPTGQWDLSPLAVVVLLGALRLWLVRCSQL